MPLADAAPEVHVSLGRVFEYGEDFVLLVNVIQQRFHEGAIPVYGSQPYGRHELIRLPLMYGIDWSGKPVAGISEHEPCARRGGSRANPDDIYYSLTMPATHWDRLCTELLPNEPGEAVEPSIDTSAELLPNEPGEAVEPSIDTSVELPPNEPGEVVELQLAEQATAAKKTRIRSDARIHQFFGALKPGSIEKHPDVLFTNFLDWYAKRPGMKPLPKNQRRLKIKFLKARHEALGGI